MQKPPAVPVENVAEILWGILLVSYLLTAGRSEFLGPPVMIVFGISAAAALLDLYLRRRGWPHVDLYDSVVWTVLLSAMVAVTGGRSSEVWPAYVLMSLTAPSLGRPLLHYGLLALNSLAYALICLLVDPLGTPLQAELLLLRIGLFFLVAYVVDRSMARERQALEQAVAASQARVAELVNARDAERRRIAGDIHDWLGSGIVAPIRKLELAQRAADAEVGSLRVGEALEMLRRSHEELRRVMERLHPHQLEQMGLGQALRSYLELWGENQGLEVAYQGDSAPEPPADVALAAYRILQEALNNTDRHAQASRATVTLALRDGSLLLTVADNGLGFASPSPGGRGLQGMRERAEALGGRVSVRSTPGQGTTVSAAIPYVAKEAGQA